MKKGIKNIIVGATIIGLGAIIFRFEKKKYLERTEQEDLERKNYQLGENTKRKYIKIGEINESKLKKLESEIEDVKQKKKTM